MPTILRPFTPSPTFKRLEVRLDTPVIHTPLYSDNAPNRSVRVRGRVVLMNQNEVSAKEIIVTFKGRRQISWYTDALKPQRVRNKEILVSKQIRLCPSTTPSSTKKSYPIKPGNHVWTFAFDLDAVPAESVDGLGDTWVAYHVMAKVVTAGYLTKNITATMQVKIVRMMETDAPYLIDLHQSEAGSWSDSLRYHVSAPPRSHHWGRALTVLLEFQPLVKDVEIEQIVARFLEEIHLRACAEHRDLFHRRGMVVSQVEASSTDNASLILDDAGMVPDSHRFRLELPLPQTLKVCRQSVTQDRIRITHNLEVRLRIRSKFGVVDSISLRFPYHLSMPYESFSHGSGVDCSSTHPPDLSQHMRGAGETLSAPPTFEEHYSDPIFRPDIIVPTFTSQEANAYVQQSQTNYQALCTTQPSQFDFPLESAQPFDLAILAEPIRLDRIPSYPTAIRTPEIYTDITDQRPAYVAVNGIAQRC